MHIVGVRLVLYVLNVVTRMIVCSEDPLNSRNSFKVSNRVILQ